MTPKQDLLAALDGLEELALGARPDALPPATELAALIRAHIESAPDLEGVRVVEHNEHCRCDRCLDAAEAAPLPAPAPEDGAAVEAALEYVLSQGRRAATHPVESEKVGRAERVLRAALARRRDGGAVARVLAIRGSKVMRWSENRCTASLVWHSVTATGPTPESAAAAALEQLEADGG